MRCVLLSACLATFAILPSHPSGAQVTPDGTLNTSVTTLGNDTTITSGTAAGGNLFHSFGQFSIPTGGSATFDLVNTPNISTIFSRVAGGSVSNIDGAIQTINGSNPVSLFLINPKGILFGPNASLNIGGSFVGSTASSIKFTDGTEFSATSPTATPLLTMNVPVGLQMGNNPGAISIQGSGHTLMAQHPTLAPYIQTRLHGGLAVPFGQTLALIGGKIEFNGGIVTAPGGRVELGSVAEGTVRFVSTPQGLNFNYANVVGFGDVYLKAGSLVDVSGLNAGSIQVQGRQVSLTDGSVLWVQNRGLQSAGSILVDASEGLTVKGTTLDFRVASSIWNETVAPGAGGNIQLSSVQIQIADGASIEAKTYSAAPSGAIVLTSKNLTVQGYIPQAPDIFSILGSLTFGQGSAGNLTISTQQMTVQTGGYIGSTTLGLGHGGNVSIQADAITVDGTTPTLIPSGIFATTLGRSADSGTLNINTRTLSLSNSGFVTTSSITVGSAGNLVVNASEWIDIDGRHTPGVYPSAISSNIANPTPAYAQAFGLTETPRGSAGSVTVNTPRLRIWDNGLISTGNDTLGDAGTVSITADSILLDRGAQIVAYTLTGEGGNVDIQAQNLILRHGSSISATASELGNGGNITINAGVIAAFENSDIIANAVQGRGGNIQITTQGIFGLKFRPQLTPDSDITASSQFGLNGIVRVNTIGVDPSAGLVELPVNLADPSRQIGAGCGTNDDNSFVVTGRGGIPDDPTQPLRSDRTWADTRDLSQFLTPSSARSAPTAATAPPVSIVEASTLSYINGQLELVAANSLVSTIKAATCARAIPFL
jgi:filamentous hemagglutinin family protein